MITISKEQEAFYQELREIEKEMRQAAEQSKAYENSHTFLVRTIKKNELTLKQLQKIPSDRSIFVPLGRAFLKRDKESTLKQFVLANEKLNQSAKDMEKNAKLYADKASEKLKILKQGSQKLTKK